MISKLDIDVIGAPTSEHRHHRLRELGSLVAAATGALAVMVTGFVIIAGIGPADGAWAWIAVHVLALVWITGLWWRWDSPDRRRKADERARRGF